MFECLVKEDLLLEGQSPGVKTWDPEIRDRDIWMGPPEDVDSADFQANI